MRILFWCDTYYQLIVAIQLRLTLLAGGEADLVLTDHSVGAENRALLLREEGLFDGVKYIETKHLMYGNKKLGKIKTIIASSFAWEKWPDAHSYDEVLFFGLNPWLYQIGDCSLKLGKQVVWSRFEEGLVSYYSDFNMGKLDRAIEPLRKLARRYRITEEAHRYYCFFPKLKLNDGNWDLVEIPKITTRSDHLVSLLKRVFEYDGFPYSQKYIFFASSQEVDGTPTGESEVVLKLAERVGTNNLLVKTHPRDGRSIYQNAGIVTMDHSHTPWEVVQLCEDLSDRVLLTCTSGAPLAVTALRNDETRGAYLNPDNAAPQEYINLRKARTAVMATLNLLHQQGLCKGIVEMGIDEFCESLESDLSSYR